MASAPPGDSGGGDALWSRRVEPGQPVPPPPPELVQWATNALLATLAGTMYGAARAHWSREMPSPEVHPQARAAPPRARPNVVRDAHGLSR